jgi:hypothetical protein
MKYDFSVTLALVQVLNNSVVIKMTPSVTR